MPANPKLSSEVHPGRKTLVLVSAVNFNNSVFFVTACRLVATCLSNLVILGSWKIHILSYAN